MNKNYIILAEGFEPIEALTVVDILRRGNIDITMMSNNDQLDVLASHNILVKADQAFNAEALQTAATIILPGGTVGTENLAKNQTLLAILKQHVENNKLTAAICAAPSILAQQGFLTGKKATSHPSYHQELEATDVTYVFGKTVKDGQFITSYGMSGSLEFALTLLETLADAETVNKVKKGIVFQQ